MNRLTIHDIDISSEINLPFRIHPKNKSTDAMGDFCIRFSEWTNYICEVLLFSHLGSNVPVSDFSVLPKIKISDFFKQDKNKLISVPKINVTGSNIDTISKNLAKNLFHHSISQLVTNFEIFLNEISEDILWRNKQLLAVDEKQLTTKEIFELKDLETIQSILIDRKIMNSAMSSYPKRVEEFQKLFHIGIHAKKSPMLLAEIHDMIEVRNVIQHNDGHTSLHYLDRMSVYSDSEYTKLLKSEHSTLNINYTWLLDFGQRMVLLAEYIDTEVNSKWNTTANSD